MFVGDQLHAEKSYWKLEILLDFIPMKCVVTFLLREWRLRFKTAYPLSYSSFSSPCFFHLHFYYVLGCSVLLFIRLFNFSNATLAYVLKYLRKFQVFRGEDIKINAFFDWLGHNKSSTVLVDRASISYYSGVLTVNNSETCANIQTLEKK